MTVSTTSSFEFNIGQIVLMAYRDSGLVSIYQANLSDPQMSDGLDKLTRITTDAQSRGMFARTTVLQTVEPLEEGVDTYNLSADTLDVIGPAMYADPQQSDPAESETMVTAISKEKWHQLGTKATESRPTMFYVDRTLDLLSVRIWPIPGATEAGGKIRLQTHRFRADVRDPSATVDFERYWTDYLVAELAAKLAISNQLPMERVQLLRGIASSKLGECRSASREKVNHQISIGHRSQWSGR